MAAPALTVCGVGAGLFTPAFFASALHHVRPQEVGSAAGLRNAIQQLGATPGVAVLGSLFFGHDFPATPGHASGAVQLVFIVGGVLVTTAAVTAALMSGRG